MSTGSTTGTSTGTAPGRAKQVPTAGAFWTDYDLVLTPGLAQRPVRIGAIDACRDDPWEDFRRSGQFTPYTAIFNVTGQPAISLPLHVNGDGIPVGVQFVAKYAREDLLLRVAAQLEDAMPWRGRRPAVHA